MSGAMLPVFVLYSARLHSVVTRQEKVLAVWHAEAALRVRLRELLGSAVLRWSQLSVSRAFEKWKDWALRQASLQRRMRTVMSRLMGRTLHWAFYMMRWVLQMSFLWEGAADPSAVHWKLQSHIVGTQYVSTYSTHISYDYKQSKRPSNMVQSYKQASEVLTSAMRCLFCPYAGSMLCASAAPGLPDTTGSGLWPQLPWGPGGSWHLMQPCSGGCWRMLGSACRRGCCQKPFTGGGMSCRPSNGRLQP